MVDHSLIQELYKGEEQRDASSSIRGFLYQDLLSLDLLLDLTDNDKLYTECVEDICILTASSIQIYQAKYYPKSSISFDDIFFNLLYQYLRIKELDCTLEIIPSLLYFSKQELNNRLSDKSLDFCRAHFSGETTLCDTFESCKTIKERQQFIFNHCLTEEKLEFFKTQFLLKNKGSLIDLREDVKDKLFNTTHSYIPLPSGMDNNNYAEIILSFAISFIQSTYHEDKPIKSKNFLTLSDLIEKTKFLFSEDTVAVTKQISLYVQGLIDLYYAELYDDLPDENLQEFYSRLRNSTKQFLSELLKTRNGRFAFLNTVSRDNYKLLNFAQYPVILKDEQTKFYEHCQLIREYIAYCWKFLLNLDCSDFSQCFKMKDDLIFFEHSADNAKQSIILSGEGGRSISKYSIKNICTRIYRSSTKPKKWFCDGERRGIYTYDNDISQIVNNQNNPESNFNVAYMEPSNFFIECLDCMDFENTAEKDPNFKYILSLNCKMEK